jgi:hypothetical protein
VARDGIEPPPPAFSGLTSSAHSTEQKAVGPERAGQQHKYSYAQKKNLNECKIPSAVSTALRRHSFRSRIPACRCGAVWIRRFGLNRVGIWQDNCFKGIHCSAAIGAGFDKEFAAAAMRAAGCSMQLVLPNRTPLPATREAGLVQIAIALIDDCD